MNDRDPPKASRGEEGPGEEHDERADHRGQSEPVGAGRLDAATDIRQARKRPRDPLARWGDESIGLADVLDEIAEPLGQSDQRHLARTPVAAPQALQNPGAECVQLSDVAHVDFESRRFVRARAVDERLQAHGIVGGPGARSCDCELADARRAHDETLPARL
jgi:hypothetical protein